MRFALWEMKHFDSCLQWIPKEMNCLIRSALLQSFTNSVTVQRLIFTCLGSALCAFILVFRQWLMIKVTSGLPSTTDRKLLRETKSPLGMTGHRLSGSQEMLF